MKPKKLKKNYKKSVPIFFLKNGVYFAELMVVSQYKNLIRNTLKFFSLKV